MWIWIIIGAILSAFPIKCIQKYLDLSVKEKMDNYYLLIIAVLANVILVYIYYQTMLNGNGVVMYTLLKIISILVLVLYGLFIDKTFIVNFNKMAGIACAVAAIYLLQ